MREPPPPVPTQIPFPPTPENREKLQEWLLDHFASSAFNVCEHQQLPQMTGQPMTCHFRPNVEPKAFHSLLPVPHHWKAAVKGDLDRDVLLGTIEPVPQGTPTKWCARAIVVPKKDGTPRRTVDLQYLNAATYRETHHVPSAFNQASTVPPNTKKTVLDAWNGYHSLLLDPVSRDATTFLQNGADTATFAPHRASMRQVMPIPAALMTSLLICLGNQRSLMTQSCGMTL